MLAIVIPYYRSTFFEATLKSLATQTNKNFKVYIGDDNSPNDPTQILAKYTYQFDFEYTKFETNLGKNNLVHQWNRCIDLATSSDWILILGDDDVLDANVIASFHDHKSKFENYNVVRFASCKINENGDVISNVYENPTIELATDFIFRDNRSSLSEYVFKKEQIHKIGFKNLPLAWFSDILAVLEFSNFKEIYSINEAVVSVRISAESISGTEENYKLKIKASFDFYYYLLTEKKHHFSVTKFDRLLELLTIYYLSDKKVLRHFYKTSKIYLSNFKFLGYFKFMRSFMLKIVKK